MNSRGNNILLFFIVLMFAWLVVDHLHTHFRIILPVILFALTYHFYKKGRTLLMWLSVIFALLSLPDVVPYIQVGGVIIFTLILYIGLRMLKGNVSPREIDIDKDLPLRGKRKQENF